MSVTGNHNVHRCVGAEKIRCLAVVTGNGTGTPTADSKNREVTVARTSKGLLTASIAQNGSLSFMDIKANVLHVNAGRARLRASVKSQTTTANANAVAIEVINEAIPPQLEALKAADAAANTTTAEYVVMSIPANCTVEAVDIFPMAAVTADASNNATLTLKGYDAAGANGVTVASLVTDVAGGNWSALTRKAMTLTATAADLDRVAQSALTLTVAKGGSGVQLPSLQLRVTLNRLTDLSSSEKLFLDFTVQPMSV
jgi:hypothetical protein